MTTQDPMFECSSFLLLHIFKNCLLLGDASVLVRLFSSYVVFFLFYLLQRNFPVTFTSVKYRCMRWIKIWKQFYTSCLTQWYMGMSFLYDLMNCWMLTDSKRFQPRFIILCLLVCNAAIGYMFSIFKESMIYTIWL